MERDEAAYRAGVQELVEWCDSNFLALNVSKTKELVVDFRATQTDTETELIAIKGQSVDMLSAQKIPGHCHRQQAILDPPPPPRPHPHVDACYKKAQKKMYLLRKLQFFKVDQAIMQLFYQAVIQNAIFFNLICFFRNWKKRRLEKISRTAAKIMRADPLSPSDIFQRAVLRKLRYAGGHFPSTQRRCPVLCTSKAQLPSPSQSEVPDNTPAKQLHPCGDQTAQCSPLT